MLGKKVGHARFALRREGEGAVWVMASEMVMVTSASASTQTGSDQPRSELRVTERRMYAATPPYALIGAETERRSSGTVDIRRIRASSKGLTFTRTLDGRSGVPRTLPPSRETLASVLATSPLDVRQLHAGQRWSATSFSWEREADDTSLVTVRSLERRPWAGLMLDVARLDMRSLGTGLVSHADVVDGGLALRVQVGPTVTLRMEDRRVARSHVVGLDVSHSGVAVTKALGDPRARRVLALRVWGPEGWRPPQDHRQTVRPGAGGGWEVTLRVGSPGPVSAEERAQALRPDHVADSDAPSIIAQARALQGGAATAHTERPHGGLIARARRFVHRRLAKRLATHIPAASAVLERGVGDCTEHAWLLTALLRAAGIPARTVFGVAYTGDEAKVFGYHAWVEAAVGARWVTVDPMWDEQPVDATHFKLASTLEELAGVLGGLRLQVLPDPPGGLRRDGPR